MTPHSRYRPLTSADAILATGSDRAVTAGRRADLAAALIALALLLVAAAIAPSSAWRTTHREATAPAPGASSAGPPARVPASIAREVGAAYDELPLSFVPNLGQVDPAVRYYAQGQRFGFYFTQKKAVLAFAQKKRRAALDLRFVGANPDARLEVARPTGTKVNYLTGGRAEHRTGISTYQQLTYRELWPGIDMVFRGRGGSLKYEFVVHPGANVHDIGLAYAGATGLSVSGSGGLTIRTPLGRLRDARPRSYQRVGDRKVAVRSAFRLDRATGRAPAYGFAVGARYDRRYPLVIDPGLSYSTFLGGSADDHARGVAVDAAGNAYVAGGTESLDYPTTAGAYDASFNGSGSGVCDHESVACGDAFVTKLSADGSGAVYSTYLGGASPDLAWRLAVDAQGHAYVTGRTESANFPTTPGAYDTIFNAGVLDGFLTKLSPDGASLVYSTYVGGTGIDETRDVAVDAQGSAYLTGRTNSPDYPTTPGAHDTVTGGFQDAVVTKLSPDGSSLVYSTYLGGVVSPPGVTLPAGADAGWRLAVDAQGSAYVVGRTDSGDFPITAGAYDTAFNGNLDSFVTNLSPDGSSLAYSTYLGGADVDNATGLGIDDQGGAYVTGRTASGDFPTTAGAYDTALGAGGDAFVTKLNPSGSTLDYSTYLGGGGFEWGLAVDVDGRSAVVAGETGSADFPVTPTAADSSYNGNDDVFVTKLDPNGQGLVYSTFIGGTAPDGANSVALDGSGNAYLTGRTDSTDYPTTAGAYRTTASGAADSFVTKLALPPSPGPYPTPASASQIKVSLVPVFVQCGPSNNPPNGQHAPPLAMPACLPAQKPLASGPRFGPSTSASASLTVLSGDIAISASITDVESSGADYQRDGTEDLSLTQRIRLTDRANCAGPTSGCPGPFTSAGTAVEFEAGGPFNLDCVPNGDPLQPPGSDCQLSTTFNAMVPGAFAVGRQAVLQVFRSRVFIGGSGVLFAQSGIYIP